MTKKEFFGSLVGKTVEYDFGGSHPLVLNVTNTKEEQWTWADEEGVEHIAYTHAISENGWSWYSASQNNITVIG